MKSIDLAKILLDKDEGSLTKFFEVERLSLRNVKEKQSFILYAHA